MWLNSNMSNDSSLSGSWMNGTVGCSKGCSSVPETAYAGMGSAAMGGTSSSVVYFFLLISCSSLSVRKSSLFSQNSQILDKLFLP